MAVNTQVDSRQTRRLSYTDIGSDANAQATITVPELRQIDDPSDVSVEAYSIGGTVANNGCIAVVESVGEDGNGVTQLTLHFYQGGGADAPLDDLVSSTINNVYVTAEGL